jgi:hypothetical protein
MDGISGIAPDIVTAALMQRPELVVHRADLPDTVAALRRVLAQAENLFDRGGVPVVLVRPSDGGPPVARALTYNSVIFHAHKHCRPVRIDKDGSVQPLTLPAAVAKMYLDLGEWDLPPLGGVATSPLLADDGTFGTTTGYDRTRSLWCEAVPDVAVPDHPTRRDAETALRLLREAFRSFPFKDAVTIQHDGLALVDTSTPPEMAESCLLAGLLTAACRVSLDLAPGLLVTAPEVTGTGSGKGLLVRAICTVAFGAPPAAFTSGHDRQELDKRLVAELIGAAPAVFLDNVNSTALRSDTLASVMTERPARVRVMGVSQMAPLNSSAFIAVTGNGLSVSEDLGRRFLIVELDPQCEDAEARPFKPGFMESVRRRRAELLTACLIIWRWGRQNAPNLTRGLPLGSFETWAEWVRDPLLTLGCKDPVQRIRDAKAADPKRRRIADLFAMWWAHHGNRPVKAAELHETVLTIVDPQGRGRQYVASRLGQMIGTRGAGFVLTYQEPAGAKTGATYALKRTSSGAEGLPASNSSQSSRAQSVSMGALGPDELDAFRSLDAATAKKVGGMNGMVWMPGADHGSLEVAQAEGEL